MAVNTQLYNATTTGDIGNASTVLKLDTQDRPFVSATLFNGTATASYLVECSWADRSSNDEWHTLSDQDTTQGFRFEGRVPERWLRLRVDSSAANGETAQASLQATGE